MHCSCHIRVRSRPAAACEAAQAPHERMPQPAVRILPGRIQAAVRELSDADLVLALNQTARVLACCHVFEWNVARHSAKQRNPAADQHGHTRNYQTLNKACSQKSLDRDAAVDVNVL